MTLLLCGNSRFCHTREILWIVPIQFAEHSALYPKSWAPIGLPGETGRPATTIRWAPNHGRQSVFPARPSPSHNHPMDTKSRRSVCTARPSPSHNHPMGTKSWRQSVFPARPSPRHNHPMDTKSRRSVFPARRSPSHNHPMGTKSWRQSVFPARPSPSHNHPMGTKSRRSVFTARRVAWPQSFDGHQIMVPIGSSRRDGSPGSNHSTGTDVVPIRYMPESQSDLGLADRAPQNRTLSSGSRPPSFRLPFGRTTVQQRGPECSA